MEEKNNYNLFNFDGMSEVANNLIDKLAVLQAGMYLEIRLQKLV